jgi:hypothetical protein
MVAFAGVLVGRGRGQSPAEFELALTRSRSIGLGDERIREVRARCQRPLSFRADAEPLPKAIRRLAELIDVPLLIEAEEADLARTLTLPPEIETAESALRRALAGTSLSSRLCAGWLEITAKKTPHVTRIHPTADLEVSVVGPARKTSPGILFELVQRMVDCDEWRGNGGDSEMSFCSIAPGLIVTATWRQHEDIERLLAALRLAAERARRMERRGEDPGAPIPGRVDEVVHPFPPNQFPELWRRDDIITVPPSVRPTADGSRRFSGSRIEQPITLPAGPIKRFELGWIIAKQCGLRLDVDSALPADWLDQPLALDVSRDRPGASAVRLLDLTCRRRWRESPGRLHLTSRTEVVTHTFDVRDLIEMPTRDGRRVTLELEDLVYSTVDTGGWAVNGGDARGFQDPVAGTLRIQGDFRRLVGVDRFLELLRTSRREARTQFALAGLPSFEQWMRFEHEPPRSGEPPTTRVLPPLPRANLSFAELTAPISLRPEHAGLVGRVRPEERKQGAGSSSVKTRGLDDDRLEVFLHPVGDLVDDPKNTGTELFFLGDHILQTIDSEEWNHNGGDASLVAHDETRCLAILQTLERHRAIHEHLTRLRSAPRRRWR